MEGKGKSNLSSNVADLLRNAGSNLGINLAGKSNLPSMDEEIVDAMNAIIGSENRPINFVDGKKGPRYFDDDCGLGDHVANLGIEGKNGDGHNFSVLNLLSRSVEHYENTKLEHPWDGKPMVGS